MWVIDDFHDAEDCAQIIEAGRDTQMHGKVCVAGVATANDPRTKGDTWLDQCADARLVALVKKKRMGVEHLSSENSEMIRVLRCRKGEQEKGP